MAQQQTSPSGKIVTYRIAKWSLAITVWIWTAVIIQFLVQFVPNVLTTPDPVGSLKDTWTALAISWLRTPSNAPIQEILRLIALGVALLLVIIPPVAFFVKQLLQNVQREGFDKLIDILDQDTVSPKFEELSRQLWYQHTEQLNVLSNGFSHIDASVSQSLNAHLSQLSTLLQQQLALQKQSAQALLTMQATLKQSTVSTQLQQLDSFYGQEREVQQEIASNLQLISSGLKQIQDQLGSIIPPKNQHDGNPQSSGLLVTDPTMVALVPSPQVNRHWHTGANSAPDPDTAGLDD